MYERYDMNTDLIIDTITTPEVIESIAIYTDKITSFFVFSVIITFIILGITQLKNVSKWMKIGFFIFTPSLLYIALPFGIALFQLEPELIIDNKGVEFHRLGKVPWDEIQSIEQKKGRRASGRFLIITLKPESTWQPQSASLFALAKFDQEKHEIRILRAYLEITREKLLNPFEKRAPRSVGIK